MNFDSIGGSV